MILVHQEGLKVLGLAGLGRANPCSCDQAVASLPGLSFHRTEALEPSLDGTSLTLGWQLPVDISLPN